MRLTVQIMAWQETEALHSGPWISGQGGWAEALSTSGIVSGSVYIF